MMLEEMNDDDYFLQKPITEFESGMSEKNDLSYFYGSMQGWRKSMVNIKKTIILKEDAIMIEDELSKWIYLFGVFDGHGGDEISKYVA